MALDGVDLPDARIRWGDSRQITFVGSAIAPLAPITVAELVRVQFNRAATWQVQFVVDFVAGFATEAVPMTITFRTRIGVGAAAVSIDTVLTAGPPYAQIADVGVIPADTISIDAVVSGSPAVAITHAMKISAYVAPYSIDTRVSDAF